MSTLFRPVSLVILVLFVGVGLAFSQEQLGEPLSDNLGTTVGCEEGGLRECTYCRWPFSGLFLR